MFWQPVVCQVNPNVDHNVFPGPLTAVEELEKAFVVPQRVPVAEAKSDEQPGPLRNKCVSLEDQLPTYSRFHLQLREVRLSEEEIVDR